MTQSQHTPGPWRTVTDGISHWVEIDGKIVIVSKGENVKANANLIAAAPELLEAAQNARNAIAALVVGDLKASDFTNDSPALNSLRKAIKKAKGNANA